MSQKPDDPRLLARKKRQAAALKANMKKRKEAAKGEQTEALLNKPAK